MKYLGPKLCEMIELTTLQKIK